MNSNPSFSIVLGLRSVKAFEKFLLERYFSAVCNEGGGIILIGVETKNQILNATGMKFHNENSI